MLISKQLNKMFLKWQVTHRISQCFFLNTVLHFINCTYSLKSMHVSCKLDVILLIFINTLTYSRKYKKYLSDWAFTRNRKLELRRRRRQRASARGTLRKLSCSIWRRRKKSPSKKTPTSRKRKSSRDSRKLSGAWTMKLKLVSLLP